MKLSIQKLDESDPLALYLQYANDLHGPMPWDIVADWRRGTVSAEIVSDRNTWTMYEHNGFSTHFRIPFPVLPASANALIEKILPRLEEIGDGWDDDGSQGFFSPEAKAQIAALTFDLEDLQTDMDLLVIWNAADFFQDAPIDVAADATDDFLDRLETNLRAAHEGDQDCHHIAYLDEYLRSRRDEAREALEEADAE